MKKYLLGTLVGGIMEQPEFYFEPPFYVIYSNDEKEAIKKYNNINNCSYFYGGIMCVVNEEWKACMVDKDVTECRCNEILQIIKNEIQKTKVNLGDFITFYDKDNTPLYIALIKEVLSPDYFECYVALNISSGDVRSVGIRTKGDFRLSTADEKKLLLDKLITIKKKV